MRHEIPRRRPLRLKGFDYTSEGAYFVTICTHQRACLLGDMIKEEVRLSPFGLIVQEEWLRTPLVRVDVSLDEYVIMPNHIHGILVLHERVGATRRVAPTTDQRHAVLIPGMVGAIIGQFKSIATKRINALRGTPRADLWQRNYYEHVVRDEQDLRRLREYITNNPLRWALDEENPSRMRARPRG